MMSVSRIDLSSRDLIPGPMQPQFGVVSQMDSGVKPRNDRLGLVQVGVNV